MPGYRIEHKGERFSILTSKSVALGVHSVILTLGEGGTKAEAMTNALHTIDRTINAMASIRLELLDQVPINDGGRGV
jgi:hypothetical protein